MIFEATFLDSVKNLDNFGAPLNDFCVCYLVTKCYAI